MTTTNKIQERIGKGDSMPSRRATYETMHRAMCAALHDLSILAGDIVGPAGVSWQDVAGTCATNLEVLARQLHAARQGNCEPFVTFPSPTEWVEVE